MRSHGSPRADSPFEDRRANRWLLTRAFLRRWFLANSLVSGVLALCWLLLRSGSKPSRFAYPCQQAALSSATLAFGVPLVAGLLTARRRLAAGLRTRTGAAVAALGLLASAGLWGLFSRADEYTGPRLDPPRDYRAKLYHVTDCPQDPLGDRFLGLDNLITLMGREGLKFYQSSAASPVAGPDGIIASDDVVVIKINYRWSQRGGTNTDLLRGLIRCVLDHPDTFAGEIVVCENAQFVGTYGFDRGSSNAQDHDLSPHDVVVGFQQAGHPVSHYDWTLVRGIPVSEYSEGDLADGYVVYDYNQQVDGRVSYPKFQTPSGTYVSLKYGAWDPQSATYDSQHVKFINVPVLKSHSGYGVTACVKNYMGVVTGTLGTNSHDATRLGILGAHLGKTRLADLNILDVIWINALPGNGPSTYYDDATRRDELIASLDPVAADIWAAKNILIPAFIANGYSPPFAGADPDDPGSDFRQYLDTSMYQILAAGYNVTNDLSRIDVTRWNAVIYVDDDATGPTHDGLSWCTAFVDLQDALDLAGPGTTIRVADGTYTPDRGTGDRTATFQLLNDVIIEGGYAGCGASDPDERDIELYETILSGDLTGNDAPVSCIQDYPDCWFFGRRCVDGFCIVKNNNDENSYRVVTGSSTNATAILDGFIITAGANDRDWPDGWGGGMFSDSGSPALSNCTFRGNSAEYGAGMCNFNESSPKLANCSFTLNLATHAGGGLYNYESSSPTLTKCSFNRNSAVEGSGGGLFNSYYCDTTLTNCTFSGNSAPFFAGGMYNYWSSNSILINCTFSGNSTESRGGGMHNYDSSPTLTNCTFSRNSTVGEGGGMYTWSGSPVVYNCVFWGNIDGGGTDQSAQIDGPALVEHSCIQGGWAGGGNIGADPLFVDADGLDDIAGTGDDDLRLRPGSPCIDAADTRAVSADVADLDGDGDATERTPLDLDGNPRFVDDPETEDTGVPDPPDYPQVVDMGAYEFPGEPCLLYDMNGDGFVSIIGDVPLFVDCVYFGDCDCPGLGCVCPGDCNCDGFLSIAGDVPCFVDCVYFGNCQDCPGE